MNHHIVKHRDYYSLSSFTGEDDRFALRLSFPSLSHLWFFRLFHHTHWNIQLKLGAWLYYDRWQKIFEFQGVSSIFHRVKPFLDWENITYYSVHGSVFRCPDSTPLLCTHWRDSWPNSTPNEISMLPFHEAAQIGRPQALSLGVKPWPSATGMIPRI